MPPRVIRDIKDGLTQFHLNITVPGYETGTLKYNNPEVVKRVYKLDEKYYVNRFKQSMDTSTNAFKGLKPRTELVSAKFLDKSKKYQIDYTFSISKTCEIADLHFFALQILDHSPDGKVLPQMTIEIRDKCLWFGYKLIDSTGHMDKGHLKKLCPIEFVGNSTQDYKIKILRSKDINEVWLNDIWKYTQTTTNQTTYPYNLNTSIGVYGDNGFDYQTCIKNYQIFEL